MLIGVIDLIPKDLVIQGVVQRWEELIVEALQKLVLNIRWLDVLEGSVQHLNQNVVVAFFIRLDPLNAHFGVNI